MDDYRDYAVTFAGIAALQIPTLISSAAKGSGLAKFQSIGFPFNMSKNVLRNHFSFSPANISAGRYYTLVTSLFNHADPHHLLANMMVLATSGRPIHSKIGRWHFLANFLGGGIAGNLAMWLHYNIQKRRFQNRDFLDANSAWSIFGNAAIGNSLSQGKEKILGSSFDSVNNCSMSCIGCSASVSAVVSFEACIAIDTIITRIRRIIQRNPNYRLGNVIEEDLHLLHELTQIFLACVMLWTDLDAMFGKSSSKTGFFDDLFAYTLDKIGHGGHLGGFLFGIVYYFVWRR